MRLCRFGEARLGIVDRLRGVRDVTAALDVLPAYRYPLPQHDVLIAHLSSVRARAEALASCGTAASARRAQAAAALSPIPGRSSLRRSTTSSHLHEVRSDSQLHHGNVEPHDHDSRSRRLPQGEQLDCGRRRRHRHPQAGPAHRPRGRARGGHRQDGVACVARRRAVVCRWLLHRPRHHHPRQRGSQPAEVPGHPQHRSDPGS